VVKKLDDNQKIPLQPKQQPEDVPQLSSKKKQKESP